METSFSMAAKIGKIKEAGILYGNGFDTFFYVDSYEFLFRSIYGRFIKVSGDAKRKFWTSLLLRRWRPGVYNKGGGEVTPPRYSEVWNSSTRMRFRRTTSSLSRES